MPATSSLTSCRCILSPSLSSLLLNRQPALSLRRRTGGVTAWVQGLPCTPFGDRHVAAEEEPIVSTSACRRCSMQSTYDGPYPLLLTTSAFTSEGIKVCHQLLSFASEDERNTTDYTPLLKFPNHQTIIEAISIKFCLRCSLLLRLAFGFQDPRQEAAFH